jgi:hypothetical protein
MELQPLSDIIDPKKLLYIIIVCTGVFYHSLEMFATASADCSADHIFQNEEILCIENVSSVHLENLVSRKNPKKIVIKNCNGVHITGALAPALEELCIENVVSLHLENVASCKMKRIVIENCDGVRITGPFSPILDDLHMEVCSNVTLRSPLGSLKNIILVDNTFEAPFRLNLSVCLRCENLRICGCENIFLDGNLPPSLRKLEILFNGMIPFPIDIGTCPRLEELVVSQEVSSIDLGENSSLRKLQVANSKNFSLLGQIPPSMEYVDFFHISFAKQPAVDFSNGKNLKIEDCEKISPSSP